MFRFSVGLFHVPLNDRVRSRRCRAHQVDESILAQLDQRFIDFLQARERQDAKRKADRATAAAARPKHARRTGLD